MESIPKKGKENRKEKKMKERRRKGYNMIEEETKILKLTEMGKMKLNTGTRVIMRLWYLTKLHIYF